MPSNNDFELSVKYGLNADMGIRGLENILLYLSHKIYLNPKLLHEYVITYNESCPNYKKYLGQIIEKIKESTEKRLPLIRITENRIARPIIEGFINPDQPHGQSNDQQRRYQLESHSPSMTDEQDRRQAQASAAMPEGVKVSYDDNELQKKSNINCLLDNYLKDRIGVTDSSGRTKEYFHGSFFSIFQKSFTQKKGAADALKSALNGDNIDLSEHLSTLRNGNLGKELRAFVKSGMANALVGKKITTVSDFVQALQEKMSNQAQPS